MSRRDKRWIVTGVAVALATGGALLVRHSSQSGGGRANADRASSAINFGASGTQLSDPPAPVVPETPASIEAEVDKSVSS